MNRIPKIYVLVHVTAALCYVSQFYLGLFYQIVDTESGAALGPNQTGEVWIRGPQTSSGFLKLPAQTKEMYVEDGWIRTG